MITQGAQHCALAAFSSSAVLTPVAVATVDRVTCWLVFTIGYFAPVDALVFALGSTGLTASACENDARAIKLAFGTTGFGASAWDSESLAIAAAFGTTGFCVST